MTPRPLDYWQAGGTIVSRMSGPLSDWMAKGLLKTLLDENDPAASDLQSALQAQAQWMRCMDRVSTTLIREAA